MNLTEPQAGSDLGALRTRAGAGGRPLPHHRPEDLHHLWRARHGRQHRAPGAGAARPTRRPAAAASRCSWCPNSCRRADGSLGSAQRSALRQPRAQARHPWQPRPASCPSATMSGAIGWLVGEPQSRARRHVHHDEQRAAPCRLARRGDRRARLSAGARLCRRARAGPAGRPPRDGGSRRSSIIPTCAACCCRCARAPRRRARSTYYAAGQIDRARHHPDAMTRDARAQRRSIC